MSNMRGVDRVSSLFSAQRTPANCSGPQNQRDLPSLENILHRQGAVLGNQQAKGGDKEGTDQEDSKVNWSTLGWSLAKKQPLSAEICRSNAEKGIDDAGLKEQRDGVMLLQRSLAYLIPKVTEEFYVCLGEWCQKTTEALKLFQEYHHIQSEKGVADQQIWDKLSTEVSAKDVKEAKKREERLKDQKNREQEKLQRKEHRNQESSNMFKNMMDACQTNLSGSASGAGQQTQQTTGQLQGAGQQGTGQQSQQTTGSSKGAVQPQQTTGQLQGTGQQSQQTTGQLQGTGQQSQQTTGSSKGAVQPQQMTG
ncbi:unnamed protein product, partial [Symbiodinium pilosum]